MKITKKLLSLVLWGLAFPLCSQAQVIKVACVGDSITEGAGLLSPYPVALGRLLGTNYACQNFGVSGTTLLKRGDSPYWSQQAFRNATNYGPNVVTIMLGTNDSKPLNWQYATQFATDLRAMIDAFANLPSHPRIILCLPVPAYGLNFTIVPEVIKNEVIPTIKQVAKERGLMTVNTYSALSGRPELFQDLIHPNNAGAALIAKALHGAVLNAK